VAVATETEHQRLPSTLQVSRIKGELNGYQGECWQERAARALPGRAEKSASYMAAALQMSPVGPEDNWKDMFFVGYTQ
jgi:hypothetical protein